MRIDKSKIIVSFDYSPESHFLVHAKDDRFSNGVDGEGNVLKVWTLNPRLDMSYKGKDDQWAIADLYLSDEEAKELKTLGFGVIEE